jgi:hypothetical protein
MIPKLVILGRLVEREEIVVCGVPKGGGVAQMPPICWESWKLRSLSFLFDSLNQTSGRKEFPSHTFDLDI